MRNVLILAVLAGSASCVADVIDFDRVSPVRIVGNGTGSHTDRGFGFTPSFGSASGYIIVGNYQPENNPQHNQAMVNNGTPNLVCANHVVLKIAGVDGRAFNLARFEIGGTFNQEEVHRWSWASGVTIVGHRAGGGQDYTKWYELNDDGQIDHAMNTVVLNWTGLSSVEFVPERSLIGLGANDYEFTIDTVEVEFVVPFCDADVNFDGFVNGDDYDAFAVAFDAAVAAADFNGDGFVNGDDYDAFAIAFDVGC
ncbi:MAG: hypothetical protein JNL50_01365 [Phycisphaerae bacterium]|nr:hypothetical protein [Phycisphaerae bacterium]